jgi:hypothetical protein
MPLTEVSNCMLFFFAAGLFFTDMVKSLLLGAVFVPPLVGAFTYILQRAGPWVPLQLWAFVLVRAHTGGWLRLRSIRQGTAPAAAVFVRINSCNVRTQSFAACRLQVKQKHSPTDTTQQHHIQPAKNVFLLSQVVSLFVMTIYPVVIAPLFNKYELLPEGSLREKIEALAGSLKFPLKKLYKMDGSKRSSHSNAYM